MMQQTLDWDNTSLQSSFVKSQDVSLSIAVSQDVSLPIAVSQDVSLADAKS